jgi:hypothetical protein
MLTAPPLTTEVPPPMNQHRLQIVESIPFDGTFQRIPKRWVTRHDTIFDPRWLSRQWIHTRKRDYAALGLGRSAARSENRWPDY